MSRRAKASAGRSSPWELCRIERDAERQLSFADALRAAAVEATAYQHAVVEPLPELANEVERVAHRLGDVAPFHWQRLNRVVAELRAVAAELTVEVPR
jgi:hypothetical protein